MIRPFVPKQRGNGGAAGAANTGSSGTSADSAAATPAPAPVLQGGVVGSVASEAVRSGSGGQVVRELGSPDSGAHSKKARVEK